MDWSNTPASSEGSRVGWVYSCLRNCFTSVRRLEVRSFLSSPPFLDEHLGALIGDFYYTFFIATAARNSL
jgi:hypothetical protein